MDHSCASGGDPDGGASPGGPTRGGSFNGSGGTDDMAGLSNIAGAAEGGAGSAPLADTGAGGAAENPCDRCAILPKELVAPCASKPYSAVLHVSGGVAPYAWQLTPAVDGWSIAADPGQVGRAILSADAAAQGDTTLTVRAIDMRGLETQLTYRTRARDACWFAYTAGGPGGPKLSLLDALSEPAQPAQLEHNADVSDFQFSPDGRYVVYRYGAAPQAPHGGHLALVQLSPLAEQDLAFGEDAVTTYAWSPDASVLAVGFSANIGQFLGGVRLPAHGSPDSPTALAPAPAFVEDNLAWVGNDAVAYHAELLPDLDHPGQFLPSPEHLRTPFYAQLGIAGFGGSQFASDRFDGNVLLQPAHDGFWIINSLSTFFPMTGSAGDRVTHYDAMLVAPSGNYSASLDAETLQLFGAHDGFNVLAASKPGEACPMPLAWSRQDRVACVADIDNGSGLGTHGEVRFFDLKLGSDLLTLSTLKGFCEDDISASSNTSCTALREGYGYGISEATGTPRGFSASGRWFAFTRATENDGAYLYWADLEASPPGLSGSLFLGNTGSPAGLAFSPDSRKVGVEVGANLVIKTLSGVSPEMLVTTQLPTIDKCIEELPNAPERYCGNTSLDAPFKWAPDSAALAYRAGGSVTVVDTSHSADLVKFSLPVPLCGAPLCSGGFEFQPPISY
jgi:hypothetical protein